MCFIFILSFAWYQANGLQMILIWHQVCWLKFGQLIVSRHIPQHTHTHWKFYTRFIHRRFTRPMAFIRSTCASKMLIPHIHTDSRRTPNTSHLSNVWYWETTQMLDVYALCVSFQMNFNKFWDTVDFKTNSFFFHVTNIILIIFKLVALNSISRFLC